MMQKLIDILYHPISPLVILSIVWAAINATYLIAGMTPSLTFEVVASLCWAFMLIYWMVADARYHKNVPCFDFGFLCYVFFPFTVVWYCFWSRGWRGILTLLGLIALFYVPYIVTVIVWSMLYETF